MRGSIFKFFCLSLLLAVHLMSKESKFNPRDPVTILFLGDSLTEGYLVNEEYSYPSLVKENLLGKKYNVKIVNGGLRGDTTAGGLNRYKWFLKTDFDVLFLALGSNDGLRGINLVNIRKNLKEIIEKSKKKGVKVILAGLNIPPNYGEDYANGFAELFEDLAKEENVLYYPFLLKNVAGKIELNHNDGIHPNEDGYKIIARRMTDYLIKNLYEKK